jgi:glycosyltransferase involved in cell wall biosynthesis
MLSDYQSRTDEGVTNTAFHLAREISQRHELLHVCLQPYAKMLNPGYWATIRKFNPHIIHFVPGPTIKSFLIVRWAGFLCPGAKTVMSGTHPALTSLSKRLVPFLTPDLVLAQSPESHGMFSDMGCRTSFLPSGVDLDKFAPVSEETRNKLRDKYGLPRDAWIALHVGPLKRGRNVLSLNRLVQEEVHVLIVGSLTVPWEPAVHRGLVEGGCTVWQRYFENVSDIYGLADCYIFPTTDKDNCIEMPLSIMEAMACNLPVLTTPFRAIPNLFPQGDGLHFFSGENGMVEAVKRIREGDIAPRTREKVAGYSWSAIGKQLEEIYCEVAS